MADALDYLCRVCDERVCRAVHGARDAARDTRSFDYLECPACGWIQIKDILTDLYAVLPRRHTGTSLEARPAWPDAPSAARCVRPQARRNLVGGLMLALSRPEWVGWMMRTRACADSRILDVGYGDGAPLNSLSASGYRDLTGIDPLWSSTHPA